MTEEEPLVGTVAAARAVGVDRATLSRWVSEGRVRSELTTAGGHHRWKVSSLRAQLAALREQPPPE